ncbi:hypothetical protein FQR65_LT12726 [Abscondita terminalis]|nr:hypothetical protein FQR65_LT12726 [Abscondita terminalis]
MAENESLTNNGVDSSHGDARPNQPEQEMRSYEYAQEMRAIIAAQTEAIGKLTEMAMATMQRPQTDDVPTHILLREGPPRGKKPQPVAEDDS